MSTGLNVLVVDHSSSESAVLKALLTELGHSVVLSDNSDQAIALFDANSIQVVCLSLDAQCKALAMTIKTMAGERFVPILFLSKVAASTELSECLQVDGTDFLVKPYAPELINAKLNAVERILEMQSTLETQRDAMSLFNEKLLHEQRVAKVVYENITHSNCLNDPAIKTFHHGGDTFNGDVILAAYKPNGGMHLLLGDFAGHGLSAAIGALPLADIFFDWTKKGFLMRQIILEVNAKLKNILPADMFCSAAFIDIQPNDKNIEVWNGGLPDVFFFSPSSGRAKKFKSKNLPLGILSSAECELTIDSSSFQADDVLLAYSDGVKDAITRDGRLFCDSILASLYDKNTNPQTNLSWLIDRMEEEAVLDNPDDDICCLQVCLYDQIGVQSNDVLRVVNATEAPADFSFEYVLNADSLRSTDPLPYVLQIINTVPGLGQFSSHVFMILSELYSNALEHGVLNLSSTKKNSLEGFSAYYEDREQALLALTEGFVKINVQVISDVNSYLGKLILTVTDSGSGFDYKSVKLNVDNTEVFHSRGLALLTQLCEKLVFSNNGRTVTAHFHWHTG